MFLGEFNHSIDPKNRVIIPAKFRDELGENFVVSAGLDGCLYMWKTEDWFKFIERLEDLPFTRETREFQRFFSKNSCDVEVDKQGRILLKENLKSLAGIEKDIVFVGAIGKVELWARERIDGAVPSASMEDIADKLAADYGLKFK